MAGKRKEDISTSFEGTFGDIRLGLKLGSEEFFGAMVKEFKRDGIRWDTAMGRRFSGPLHLGPGKPAGSRLASRQGESGLRGSMGWNVTHQGKLDTIELHKFSTSPYAITHELGTKAAGGKVDLRPKKGRYLTIPLRDAMTPSGVAKKPSARDWPDTFVFATDAGKLFIVSDAEGDTPEDLLWLYLLFPGEPKIPARLGMNQTHIDQQRHRTRGFTRAILGSLKKGAKRGKRSRRK